MLSSLKVQDAKREEGFTLIELLVVVIIIGILAAIAIPAFLNQRESAWQGSVESDVRNAAIQIETLATRDRGVYPDPTTFVEADEFETSSDVTLVYTQAIADTQYEICGAHASLPGESITYDSNAGGLANTAWDDTTGC